MRSSLLIALWAIAQAAFAQDGVECHRLVSIEARELCQKIEHSKATLASVKLSLISDKRGAVIEREAALALCPEGDGPVRIIKIRIPFRPKPDQEIIPTIVGGKEYRLRHVRGQYMYKLQFRAFHDIGEGKSEEVPICSSKHIFIPPQYRRSSELASLERHRVDKVYLTMTKDTYHEEFFARGLETMRTQMAQVFTKLSNDRVPSLAFPGRSLAEIYFPEQLVKLFVIEQADPLRRYGLPLYGKPQRPEPEIMRYVFAELFLYGDDAFRYLCSGSLACGRFQFTNNPVWTKKGLYEGTYTTVRRSCKDGDGKQFLNEDFWEGTADWKNSAMAAVCLYDAELAALPPDVRGWYLRDPEGGLALAVIAYNTGGGPARQAYEKLSKLSGWSQEEAPIRSILQIFNVNGAFELTQETFERLPGKIFLMIKHGKSFMNSEPCYYIHKWFESWKYGFGGDPAHVPDCR